MTAQAFVFFIAGYTTDTSILIFCIYELARHPNIQNEVHKSIQRVIKNQNDKQITYEDLQGIKLLDQIINGKLLKSNLSLFFSVLYEFYYPKILTVIPIKGLIKKKSLVQQMN